MTNTTTENKTTSTGNKPEKKFRAGGISATVWQNNGQNKNGEPVTFRTISLERNYKDKNEEWKSTNSFRITDLPKVALVANKAYEYIVMSDEAEKGADAPAGDMPINEEVVM